MAIQLKELLRLIRNYNSKSGLKYCLLLDEVLTEMGEAVTLRDLLRVYIGINFMRRVGREDLFRKWEN